MAEIRPFRGVRYNQKLVKDLAAVICPPYDIITPQMEQELHQKNDHNFIRLEFGRESPQDTATDNKYTRSAATLEQWLKQGILKVDKAPAIYLHDQYFNNQGREYRRRGMIVCVRLEEWDKMVIRPHEGTLAKPKDDRLSLLWALQVNTSPILAMFEDPRQQVASLLAAKSQSQPLISLRSAAGERHDVWALTEPEITTQICRILSQQPLYIADGHHRYESALNYQRQRRACSSSSSGDQAFDFVMMTLVALSDPGLITLPPHRLVRGVSKSALSGLKAELGSLFEIEELSLNLPNVWKQVDDLLTTNEVVLVLFGLAAERLLVLRLHDFTTTSRMMPAFHCELYKRLNVSIIDHVILEKLLGLNRDKEEALLGYDYDKQHAVSRVSDGEYQLAFLLSPIKPDVVKAIADAGDRLPRKSTYFYPKLPSGLVFHRFI